MTIEEEMKKYFELNAKFMKIVERSLTQDQIKSYEEEQKWIGSLVEYGNAEDGFKYGILTNIEPLYKAFPFEIDNGRDATAECWLPDESIIYKEK